VPNYQNRGPSFTIYDPNVGGMNNNSGASVTGVAVDPQNSQYIDDFQAKLDSLKKL
jgi:hypothetical protein